MNHIAGEVALAQLAPHLARLICREVGHAAHPRAVAPERQGRGEAGDTAVVVEHALDRAAADHEEVQYRLFDQPLGGPRRDVGQRQAHVTRRMHKEAVGAAGDVEGDAFVGAPAVDAQRIGVLQRHRLAGEVKLGKTFARACEFLLRVRVERVERAVGFAVPLDEGQGHGLHFGRDELVVGVNGTAVLPSG